MKSYRVSQGREDFVIDEALGLERDQLRHVLVRTKAAGEKELRSTVGLERTIEKMFGIRAAVGMSIRERRAVYFVRPLPRVNRQMPDGTWERVMDEPCMHGLVQYEIGGVQFHDVVVREGEDLLASPVLSPCLSNAAEH